MGQDTMTRNVEFLEKASRLREYIATKEEQLANLRSLTEQITIQSHERIGSGNRGVHGGGYEAALCKVMDLEAELVEDIKNMIDTIQMVKRVIARVDDKTMRLLLEMRYLTFKNWEEIGDALGYCERHIYRLHTKAVMSIRVPRTVRDHDTKQSMRMLARAM